MGIAVLLLTTAELIVPKKTLASQSCKLLCAELAKFCQLS